MCVCICMRVNLSLGLALLRVLLQMHEISWPQQAVAMVFVQYFEILFFEKAD